MSQKRQKNAKKIFEKKNFFGSKNFRRGGSLGGVWGGQFLEIQKKPSSDCRLYVILSEKSRKNIISAISTEEIDIPRNTDPKSPTFNVTPPGEKMSKLTKTFFGLNRFAISILLKKISIATF